jgi:hypothetical protein
MLDRVAGLRGWGFAAETADVSAELGALTDVEPTAPGS